MQDTIERTTHIAAPVAKVWHALTDYREFGTWFRVRLTGPFALGQITEGITEYPGFEGYPFWARTVALEAPHHFAFVWPFSEKTAPDAADLDRMTTLVTFRLAEEEAGTRLHLVESGFLNLPEDVRLQQFRNNEGGWTIQIGNVKAHAEG